MKNNYIAPATVVVPFYSDSVILSVSGPFSGVDSNTGSTFPVVDTGDGR